jgi:hypothetical protein
MEGGSTSQPAASVTKLGKGKILATYFSFSQGYLETHDAGARDTLGRLVAELFPNPTVEVRGSHDVDVLVTRIHKKLAINLVNTSGPHSTQPILESIAPVGPLDLTVRSGSRPRRVTLQPSGASLPFEYRSGDLRFVVPKVEIHEIVVID